MTKRQFRTLLKAFDSYRKKPLGDIIEDVVGGLTEDMAAVTREFDQLVAEMRGDPDSAHETDPFAVEEKMMELLTELRRARQRPLRAYH